MVSGGKIRTTLFYTYISSKATMRLDSFFNKKMWSIILLLRYQEKRGINGSDLEAIKSLMGYTIIYYTVPYLSAEPYPLIETFLSPETNKKLYALTDQGRKFADMMWQIVDGIMEKDGDITLTERVNKVIVKDKKPEIPAEEKGFMDAVDNVTKNIKLELEQIKVK